MEQVAEDAGSYVVRGVAASGDETQDEAPTGDVPTVTVTSEPDDEPAFRPLALPVRRRIGKNLQLVLLRKYVACATALGDVPDRATTERLLDQAYDEFYFHGGDVDEQRLGYAEFAKLVRNRRGEVLRCRRDRGAGPHSHHKKHAKERDEIRALIDELERVRHASNRRGSNRATQPTGQADSSVLTVSTIDTDCCSSSVSSVTVSGVAPTTPVVIHGEEHVLVSKQKLSRVLQAAQETLVTQAKLLARVQALERQLAALQDPLGH